MDLFFQTCRLGIVSLILSPCLSVCSIIEYTTIECSIVCVDDLMLFYLAVYIFIFVCGMGHKTVSHVSMTVPYICWAVKVVAKYV